MKTSLLLLVSVGVVGLQVSCRDHSKVTKITKPIEEVVVVEDEGEVPPVLVKPEIPKVDEESKEDVVEKQTGPSPMEKWLLGKTVYIENGQAVRRDISKKPSRYVFFLAGEWSGDCKERLPQVRQFYTENIKDNPDVAFVVVSADQPKWVLKWATDEKFEWPLLFGDDLKEVPFLYKEAARYAFYFMMYDSEGESLSTVYMEDCLPHLTNTKK